MLKSLLKTTLFLLLLFVSAGLYAQCNGHSELCDRRYDEVAYLTTHNAFNAGEEGFSLPNQTYGLTRQLQDGVRAVMLDVYDEGGVATAYHGFAFLGTATLESNLTEIKDFLDANPNEIVTIIFESYINSTMMDTVFTQVGLKPMLHEQTVGEPWPTLQEMINSGKRLFVLSDNNDAAVGQEWYHYVWDFAVETGFTINAPTDFDCDFNRGNSANDLFIVNHFVTDANIGTGQADQAAIVNEMSFFYDRVYGCQIEQQKFPNFPTVDFYELGQTLAVVDSLNGLQTSVGIRPVLELPFSVYPNPSNGVFQIDVNSLNEKATYSIFDITGKRIIESSLSSQSTIDLTNRPEGIYFLSIMLPKGRETIKLVNLPD